MGEGIWEGRSMDNRNIESTIVGPISTILGLLLGQLTWFWHSIIRFTANPTSPSPRTIDANAKALCLSQSFCKCVISSGPTRAKRSRYSCYHLRPVSHLISNIKEGKQWDSIFVCTQIKMYYWGRQSENLYSQKNEKNTSATAQNHNFRTPIGI